MIAAEAVRTSVRKEEKRELRDSEGARRDGTGDILLVAPDASPAGEVCERPAGDAASQERERVRGLRGRRGSPAQRARRK